MSGCSYIERHALCVQMPFTGATNHSLQPNDGIPASAHANIFSLSRVTHAGPERSQLKGIDHDCNDIPDAAMTLAVAALFAQGPTRIRNVYNWRVKVQLVVLSILIQW
jgi:5-enolpyruvylshikimate-3-phosphate synthase